MCSTAREGKRSLPGGPGMQRQNRWLHGSSVVRRRQGQYILSMTIRFHSATDCACEYSVRISPDARLNRVFAKVSTAPGGNCTTEAIPSRSSSHGKSLSRRLKNRAYACYGPSASRENTVVGGGRQRSWFSPLCYCSVR